MGRCYVHRFLGEKRCTTTVGGLDVDAGRDARAAPAARRDTVHELEMVEHERVAVFFGAALVAEEAAEELHLPSARAERVRRNTSRIVEPAMRAKAATTHAERSGTATTR
jgi:hypothetical protein